MKIYKEGPKYLILMGGYVCFPIAIAGKLMGVKIYFENTRIYKGEKIADLLVVSTKSLKPINCPPKLNTAAIDEFLLIFLDLWV